MWRANQIPFFRPVWGLGFSTWFPPLETVGYIQMSLTGLEREAEEHA
jgi:hypothetical protein